MNTEWSVPDLLLALRDSDREREHAQAQVALARAEGFRAGVEAAHLEAVAALAVAEVNGRREAEAFLRDLVERLSLIGESLAPAPAPVGTRKEEP